jgi:putative salt-induced outer membrane protein YdiY
MQTTRRAWRSPRIGLSVVTAFLLTTSLAAAQDQKTALTNAPVPPKNPWNTTAAAGLTLTRGNSRTMMATFGLDTNRKWDNNEVLFGAAGGYGEDRDVKNAEFANAFGQYNRLFSERFYGGFRVSFNYDGIANLSYRVTVSPMAGYYLIKGTNTTLAVEAGPALVFEKFEHQDPSGYYAFRAGERFEHKLSATTKIWQTASYVPQVDKWSEKYILTGEAGIDTAINKHWSLRVVLQDVFDSQPAAGREHNDLRLIAGTAYKF